MAKLTVDQHAFIVDALSAALKRKRKPEGLNYGFIEEIQGKGLMFFEPTQALLSALHDIGTQDIYTDAEEYSNRANAMHDLAALAGQAAIGATIDALELQAIIEDSDDADGDN